MAGKSIDERISGYDERIKQLEARKKALEARAKQNERKERTRRLIQVGAIMAHIGVDTVDQAEALKKAFMDDTRMMEWLKTVVKAI